MIRKLLLCSLGVAFGLLSIGTSGTGAADEALEIARKRYQVGEQEFISGRYWQAAKAFEEAYDLSKRGDLLYNAARAYDRGDYTVRAIEAYEAYLKAGDASDRAQVEKRIESLRKSLASLLIKTDETAFIFVDGHEYGKTPMKEPIPMDSGYHRVEVRTGNRTWSREQQFSSGQPYQFDAYLNEEKTGPGTGLVTIGAEDRRPKPRTRRMAVVLGIGGSVDVVGENFPPHQLALSLAGEYRMMEGTYGGLDLSLKLPVDVLQGWVGSGFLVGLRGALTPVPRLPLELVLSLDAGLGVVDFRSSAPPLPQRICSSPSSLPSCTLYGVRVHPALGIAYRLSPAFELRAELLGVDVNFTSPILDPRLNFGLAAAYRF
jgi:hypothetical protein